MIRPFPPLPGLQFLKPSGGSSRPLPPYTLPQGSNTTAVHRRRRGANPPGISPPPQGLALIFIPAGGGGPPPLPPSPPPLDPLPPSPPRSSKSLPPPPPDQSDCRAKKRSLQSGKSGRAFLAHKLLGPRPPLPPRPPLQILPCPCPCSTCDWQRAVSDASTPSVSVHSAKHFALAPSQPTQNHGHALFGTCSPILLRSPARHFASSESYLQSTTSSCPRNQLHVPGEACPAALRCRP